MVVKNLISPAPLFLGSLAEEEDSEPPRIREASELRCRSTWLSVFEEEHHWAIRMNSRLGILEPWRPLLVSALEVQWGG